MHYRPLPFWATLMAPIEWGYALAVQARHGCYRMGLIKPVRVSVPVISVGNLTTGGTGKTPVVLELARGLMLVGKKVVILSRGYGATRPLDYGRPSGPEHGEEAFFLQQQLPEVTVIVGRNRAQNARRAAEEFKPDFILLDDGYQYVRLARDLNILLVDGEYGLGNAHMLPLGPLREPQEALNRADMVFITKVVTGEAMQDMEARLAACGHQEVPIFPVNFQVRGLYHPQSGQMHPATYLAERPVVAFSGIAQPDRFEQDLKKSGLTVVRHERFNDHHTYSTQDLARIYRDLPEGAVVVTTDKDWTKVKPLLASLNQPEWLSQTYLLKVSPGLDGEWFYREFLSQLFQNSETQGAEVASSS